MLYELLGRVIWVIVRGYFRHRFPNARRNTALAGVLLAGAVLAMTAARRSKSD